MRGDTAVQGQPLIGFRSVAGTKFIVHVSNGGVDLMSPFNRLNRLLGTQRDQHTEDNDRHLPNECAPSVQRLWQAEMHFRNPRAWDATRRANVRNGSNVGGKFGWKADAR